MGRRGKLAKRRLKAAKEVYAFLNNEKAAFEARLEWMAKKADSSAAPSPAPAPASGDPPKAVVGGFFAPLIGLGEMIPTFPLRTRSLVAAGRVA